MKSVRPGSWFSKEAILMSTPSKAQDPAAAALSAIEDALRLHVEPEADAAEGEGTEASPKLEFHLPTSKPEAQKPRLRSQSRRRLACPTPPSMNLASVRVKPTRRARLWRPAPCPPTMIARRLAKFCKASRPDPTPPA